MIFKKTDLEKMGLPDTAIDDNIIEHKRWSVVHEIVFAYDGKAYRTRYMVGATESQDERPWEFEEEIEAQEVHQLEKKIFVWEPK